MVAQESNTFRAVEDTSKPETENANNNEYPVRDLESEYREQLQEITEAIKTADADVVLLMERMKSTIDDQDAVDAAMNRALALQSALEIAGDQLRYMIGLAELHTTAAELKARVVNGEMGASQDAVMAAKIAGFVEAQADSGRPLAEVIKEAVDSIEAPSIQTRDGNFKGFQGEDFIGRYSKPTPNKQAA